jgi:2-keto-4-pentenoate hydratase/2-oxohepta-3-ene-1,7-dioic acid hydratase in catechol pathway
MKLASATIDGRQTYGVVEDDEFLDAGAILGERFPSLKSVLAAAALEDVRHAASHAKRHAVSGVAWLPPIADPAKIICVGLNYEEHRQETGREAVGHPTLFTRFADTQVGHGVPMVVPAPSHRLDFEGELAVVIGQPAWRLEREAAMDCVGGFACYNDGTIRDFQQHSSQFTAGKNFPATGGFGPFLVTPDVFGPVGPQRLQTRLNGTTVQSALLSEMIFDVPTLLWYCTQFTRLMPGDVLITGTPAGVGARRTPKLWMKPGDVVEVEIDGAGVLRNPIVAEAD